MNTRVGVLISTYNWPEALRACLRSLADQTRPADEVIVADDGSGPETAAVLAEFSYLPLVHVWHPDAGFRLSEIRNKGIAAARSDYLISLDGDMLLERHCVEDHVSLLRRGCFRQGSRIPLNQGVTQRLLGDAGGMPRWWHPGLTRRWKNFRWRPLANIINRSNTDAMSVRGCHQGFWRDDLISVNGFNGEIQGWGREDNELAVRLINSGVHRRNLRQSAVAFHLWHAERSRDQVSTNEAILHRTIAERSQRAVKGLEEWLAAPLAFVQLDRRPAKLDGGKT